MSSYYYLMSSLPMLKADGEMPFSYDAFLRMCSGNVSPARYQMLENLTAASSEGPMVSQWAKFYGTLNKELVYQRNQKLGRPCQAPNNRDSDAVRIITAVMNEKNPLEAEKILLTLQFQKLDELVNMHYFDDCALVGYAMKLKLLERKTVFRQQEGKAELGRIVDGLQQQIMNM